MQTSGNGLDRTRGFGEFGGFDGMVLNDFAENGMLINEHGVAVAVEAVALLDRLLIKVEDDVFAFQISWRCKRTNKHQEARLR